MWLDELLNVRIRKYPRGWVVEIQKKTWYGRRYWTHLISVAGIDSEPWYFSSYWAASEEAKRYFKRMLIEISV